MDPGRQEAAILVLRLILAGAVLAEQRMSAKPQVSDLAPAVCQIPLNRRQINQKTLSFLP
jgi:hypothetical protein